MKMTLPEIMEFENVFMCIGYITVCLMKSQKKQLIKDYGIHITMQVEVRGKSVFIISN